MLNFIVNILLALFSVMLAVSCKSESFSSKEEIMDQLLSIREDILSARRFTRMMEAATPPWSTHFHRQYYTHKRLIHGEKISQQMHILQKVMASMNAAKLEPEGMIVSDNMVAKPNMMPDPPTVRGHVAKKPKVVHTTERAKVTFIFDVPIEEMQEFIDKFQSHIFECVANSTHVFANIIPVRLDKKFNIADPTIRRFEELSDIFAGGNFDTNTLLRFVSFIVSGLMDANSRHGNLIVNKQGFGSGLIDTLRAVSKIYQNLVP